ncbi:MAG: hypothetical protein AAGN35_01890 [Bacteroidota bacterium]
MLRKYIIGFIGALLIAQLGQAQLRDKATFHGGFTYQFVSMTPQGSPSPWRIPFYGLSLGMNYTLLHSNDQVSLGINPNGNFSFIFSSLFGTSLQAQAPVFLLARVGAGATPYNEQKFGIGAGIGATYTYMLHSQIFQDNLGNLYNVRLTEGWVNPSAVVEIGLKTRFSNYLFRFNWSLIRPTLIVPELNDLPVRFGTAGLSILYTF